MRTRYATDSEYRERTLERKRLAQRKPEARERARERKRKPEYREKNREYMRRPDVRARYYKHKNEYFRSKYATDPEFRAKINAANRERYHADPKRCRTKVNAARARRMADPEYRAEVNERQRLWRSDPERRAKRNEAERVRLATDPEAAARKRSRAREYGVRRYRSDPEYRAGMAIKNAARRAMSQ